MPDAATGRRAVEVSRALGATSGPAVLSDGIIFGLNEKTGNVWMSERKERNTPR
jgi:hypothetical protein